MLLLFFFWVSHHSVLALLSPPCQTFLQSCLPTAISLDNHQPIANSTRDLWLWDCSSHRPIVWCIDPYPFKAHTAGLHPPCLASPWPHKPAISLISSRDSRLGVCVWGVSVCIWELDFWLFIKSVWLALSPLLLRDQLRQWACPHPFY